MTKETKQWETLLSSPYSATRSLVGIEWPEGVTSSTIANEKEMSKTLVEVKGEKYYPNCYPVPWIEKHWSPKLSQALKNHVNF